MFQSRGDLFRKCLFFVLAALPRRWRGTLWELERRCLALVGKERFGEARPVLGFPCDVF